MEFVILIYGDENAPGPTPGSPEFEEFMSTWMGYNAALKESGHFVSGAGLQPTATATTLQRTFGVPEPTVTDGPFAETKEQLGGFYMITAENLDEALEWARKLPLPAGSLEVRPVSILA
ncbi:MAG: YciI family protein [Kineosporiaceae bacterium]